MNELILPWRILIWHSFEYILVFNILLKEKSMKKCNVFRIIMVMQHHFKHVLHFLFLSLTSQSAQENMVKFYITTCLPKD